MTTAAFNRSAERKSMLRFAGHGVSDVGLVRPGNEDAGYVGPYVALVADGVGGAAAGEVAAATTAYAASEVALARLGDPPEDVVLAAWEAARAGVQLAVQRDLERLGMATTLTMLVCDGDRVALGHVGDSRAYLLRSGVLERISTDHTYVQRLVERGQLAPEAAGRHPWRNMVLRSVDGDPAGPGLDVTPVDARPGDRLLLCSDGLTDLVPEEVVGALLATPAADAAAEALVAAALAAGGRDNVTCIVLDLETGPRVPAAGAPLGALVEPGNVVDPATARPGGSPDAG
ncbi:PP2C family protein-serine/threonine phosphatase [Nocardioides pantholopis]|uniref:PP2C family protein-serine/threonine phosphatase n=1 Tax=Nocardioides pantholopis TaxID=2483798 RepID=UPI001F498FD0|nr:protein phosphatase 2C domain-containing protein [Nocardioides pantholopis]